jgi:hypothetical protein
MVTPVFDRRTLMASLAALPLLTNRAMAEEYIDLNWSDLVPDDQAPSFSFTQNHEDSMSTAQPESKGVRTEYNGQIVRLPGFIVPIDYSGTGVTAFILVPFVGACVHVPPPPANQLVFVTTEKPYDNSGLFEAVNVIGMFGTAATSTQIADIAYALSADEIVPFKL